MIVKGTAFLARRSMLIERVGQAKWDAFFADLQEQIPSLAAPVVASSKLPAADFLKFSDLAVERFFAGDQRVLWMFGEKSADWAISEGPYKAFFQSRDVRSFVTAAPALWQAYYSAGELKADVDEGVVDVSIHVPVQHVHFEFSVMGYVKRGLELIGTTVTRCEALKAFSLGDDHVHYRFVVR